MTNKIHTYQKRGTLLLYAPFIILLLAMMWGCIDESVNDIPTTGDKGRMVIFSLKVPNTTTPETSEPSTYALSDDDEKEITTIIALPFGSNGRTIAEPIYLSTEDITPDPVNTNIKTFTIVVREDAHSVVVFANINPNLIADLNTITAGQSKEWVANKLLVTNDGKWNATRSSTDYIPIPMWGDATIPSLSSSDAPVNVPVTLIRMLSKIDIVLTTATAKDKLDLQSVRLYNYNNKGQVAPAVSNWTTVPSIPSMAQKPSNPEESPLLYDSSTINKDGANRGISSVNEMYTFEAAAGSGIALLQNTCVVIGGKYNGANEDSYYRIDLPIPKEQVQVQQLLI